MQTIFYNRSQFFLQSQVQVVKNIVTKKILFSLRAVFSPLNRVIILRLFWLYSRLCVIATLSCL